MMKTKQIYCCGCEAKVGARLTGGKEIYPHRTDLYMLPFWKCDRCNNYVGCHHKTDKPTTPLGVIPTKELKKARQHIHFILDPIWKSGAISRNKAYKRLAKILGKANYHTAMIRSIQEARQVYKAVRVLSEELNADKVEG